MWTQDDNVSEVRALEMLGRVIYKKYMSINQAYYIVFVDVSLWWISQGLPNGVSNSALDVFFGLFFEPFRAIDIMRSGSGACIHPTWNLRRIRTGIGSLRIRITLCSRGHGRIRLIIEHARLGHSMSEKTIFTQSKANSNASVGQPKLLERN